MNRFLSCTLIILSVAGCATMADREVLKPLPEEGLPGTFILMQERARRQANLADDAYFINDFTTMDEAAKSLEQTARLLPKASEVPARQKDILPILAEDLAKEAGTLREAIKTKDEKKITKAIEAVQKKVHELH